MSTATATPTAKPKRLLDQLGMVLSTTCAIHCVLMPFLLGALAYGGFAWVSSDATELALVLSAALVAVASLFPSFRRHGNPSALLLFVGGLVVILASRALFPAHGLPFGVAMGVGGSLIALAHYRNHRLCRCHGAAPHTH